MTSKKKDPSTPESPLRLESSEHVIIDPDGSKQAQLLEDAIDVARHQHVTGQTIEQAVSALFPALDHAHHEVMVRMVENLSTRSRRS